MATYRKRNSGHWQAVIRVRGYPPRSKTGFANKTQARRWAEREEVSMRTGTWTDRSRAEQVTLADLLKRYAIEVAPGKRGYDTELLRIKQFQKHRLASRVVATLRPTDISMYIAERAGGGRAGSTINRELNLLHHLFVIARKRWGINIPNPCDDIERPKNPPGRERQLRAGEEQTLIDAARAARNPWVEPMIILAIETAMRRGELLAMQWDNIDWVQRSVYLPMTKNGHPRRVPLSPRALSCLRGLPRSLNGRVFPITLNAWRCAWKRTRQRSGLGDFRFHDLRHEATSRLFEFGLGVMDVAAITGHRDLRMLARYTHPQVQDLANKLAQVAASRYGVSHAMER